jgi:hypothetical protein
MHVSYHPLMLEINTVEGQVLKMRKTCFAIHLGQIEAKFKLGKTPQS